MDRTTNTKGLEIIKHFEGLSCVPHRRGDNRFYIGYGSLVENHPFEMITIQQAEDLLKQDLLKYETFILKSVRVSINDDQFSALVSLIHDIGEGALLFSSLLKLLNSENYIGAAAEFTKWMPQCYLSSKRRQCEKALFLSEDYTRYFLE